MQLTGGVDGFRGFADLAGKAGKYSEKVAVAGLILGGLALAAWAVGVRIPAEQDSAHSPAQPSEKEPLRR